TTLEDVASRLHVDPDDLRRANPQITASKLKPGEQILLPLPASLKPGAAPPAGPAPAPSNSRPSSRQALHEAFAKAPLNLGPELEDDEKMMARLGDEALWLYRRRKAFNALPNDMDRQVAWAHDIYTKTGQIATRYPLTDAEIKEGKVMTRAERYEKFLASQGHDPAKLFRKGELDFAKRNEFLTDSEFESEHQLRLKAEEKDLADSCPIKYHSTEQIENCQAKVWDKYYGQDGSDDYRKRMANARIAGEEYSHHIDSVKSGGPISMIGRGVDRLAGGDGEFGAAAGGLLDMKGTIAVGKSEMARQERYKATGG